MFFVFLILLFSVGYSYLFSLIGLSVWFWFLWAFLGLLCGLLTFVLFALIFLAIESKTKPKRRFKHFVLTSLVKLFNRILRVKVIYEGIENIPNETVVMYANHKSNMDPLFIYLAHRKSKTGYCTAIGKKTLFKNPIMKKVGQTFDAIPLDRENDREAAKSIVTAIKKVKNGLSMIIFPEGGIKSRDTDEMVNLRAGAYKLALKSEAPILPISIIGSSQIKTKKFFKKVIVKLVIHKPLYKDEYIGKNTTEIGHMVEEIINNGLKNN